MATNAVKIPFTEAAAPATPSAGTVVTYAKADGWMYSKDDAGVESLMSRAFVGARATANAVTSLTNATWTAIALATESFDSHAFHDLVTNNSRLTIPTGWGGKYLITGVGSFAATAAGKRGARLLLNGATVIAIHFQDYAAVGTYAVRLPVQTTYALAATDYVQLQCFQDTGGAINSESATTTLELTFLGV